MPSRRSGRQPSSTIPAKRPATDAQEEAWVADEDRFVLRQAKKKAEIRVRGGRARPIDWLAVILRAIDPTRQYDVDEDGDNDGQELDVVDPEGIFEGLDDSMLRELEKDIDTYLALETNRSNQDYWNTMKIICKDRLQRSRASAPEARGIQAVSANIDRLLSPKSYEDLEKLEAQIKQKLASNEPIDVDYWEHLLQSLLVFKAKAKLRRITQKVVSSRLEELRKQQAEDAHAVKSKLQIILGHSEANRLKYELTKLPPIPYSPSLDPEPFLKVRPEDKALDSLDEESFLSQVKEERQKIQKLGYVPMRQKPAEKTSATAVAPKAPEVPVQGLSRFAAITNEDFSQATSALYEREVARGVNENEEIFAGEEELGSASKPLWANKYRPRKPRYFNRVQMGYEWNKYNQTHYDHDHPPPKVVQGYKFNIFYPDLIDKTRAPTYRIEREHGRKKGQSFAPAGQEDTCLIRFVAGPPYEDIAFRIVDKEWDYSAKRERGFKSTFDKGILQLHFQFKKIYYRK
ncbi:mid region of cactin-domain-containing protein [Lineolata rhizophorae]|uniref:Splicing factor Cactin n=1 Tax=Lineolata rhizophorae TaxID=578093 RepID=A0A6A6P362_9PEZI|nr:mid region of cactin-domain-containing protein [Lineolata rhizophorae]